MQDLNDPFAAPISKNRPLLGVTILLVEDSRFCSEAVRLMSIRCGARLRRADCIKSAHRHLAIYRPDLMIIDLGLPDGSGLDLIKEMSTVDAEPPVILAMSGNVGGEKRQLALESGAAGFLVKPIGNLEQFKEIITKVLKGEGVKNGFLPHTIDKSPDVDSAALIDDLVHVRDILQKALPAEDKPRLHYCAQFVASVAQTAHDPELINGASHFFSRMNTGGTGQRSGGTMLALLEQRLKNGNTVRQSAYNVA